MLEEVPLVDWVYEWFHRPSPISTPQNDRIYVFQATTLLIGETIMNKCVSKEQLRTIHEYLTYLLLGWHPITEWPKPSNYEEGDEVDRWSIGKESMKSLLDFDNHSLNYYSLLSVIASATKFDKLPNGYIYGEQLTSLILALWLLNKEAPQIDHDLSAVRACLDLFYRSKATAVEQVDHEYAGLKGNLRYEIWIVKQMNRLLKLNVPTEEFLSTMAYLGWFASFIKAMRCAKCISRSDYWIEGFNMIIAGITEHHHKVLRNAELNCNARVVCEGSNITNNSRLFGLFKKHPPPVKDKFRIIRDN